MGMKSVIIVGWICAVVLRTAWGCESCGEEVDVAIDWQTQQLDAPSNLILEIDGGKSTTFSLQETGAEQAKFKKHSDSGTVNGRIVVESVGGASDEPYWVHFTLAMQACGMDLYVEGVKIPSTENGQIYIDTHYGNPLSDEEQEPPVAGDRTFTFFVLDGSGKPITPQNSDNKRYVNFELRPADNADPEAPGSGGGPEPSAGPDPSMPSGGGGNGLPSYDPKPSVGWKGSLGSAEQGGAAGLLSFRSSLLPGPGLSLDSFKLTSLNPEQVSVVRNSGDQITQILSADTLATVQENGPGNITASFFRASSVGGSGPYTSNEDPFVIYNFVETTAADGSHELRISEVRDGILRSDKTTRYQGGVLTEVDHLGGMLSNSFITLIGNGYTETRERIEEPAGTLISRIQTKYLFTANGKAVWHERREASPEGDLITTREFYPLASTEGDAVPKVKSVVSPDGSWVKYEYSGGRLSATYTPWEDSPATPAEANGANCTRVVHLEDKYGNNEILVDTTYILGVEVSRAGSERGKDGTRAYRIDLRTGTEISTIETKTGSGYAAYLQGRPLSTVYPDGSEVRYSYELGNFDPANGVFAPLATGQFLRTTVTRLESEGIVPGVTTRTVSIQGGGKTYLTLDQIAAGADSFVTLSQTQRQYDVEGNLTAEYHQGVLSQENTWEGGRLTQSVGADGLVTSYTHLPNGRTASMTRTLGSGSTTTTYTYNGSGQTIATSQAGGGLELTTSSAYQQGELVSRTDANGITRQYARSTASRTSTETGPGGQTVVTTNYLDGQIKSRVGAGIVSEYYDYGVETGGLRYTEVRFGSANSSRWERRFTDSLGNLVRIERPGPTGQISVTHYSYDVMGRVTSTQNPATLPLLTEYGPGTTRKGYDANGNGKLDLATDLQIQEQRSLHLLEGGQWYSSVSAYAYPNDATPVLMGRELTQAGTLFPSRISEDAFGQKTQISVSVNRAAKTRTETITLPTSSAPQVRQYLGGQLVSATMGPQATPVIYQYDGLGRIIQTQVTGLDPSSQTYQAGTSYLSSRTLPGQPTESYTYYGNNHINAGKVQTATRSGLGTTTYTYDAQGNLASSSGETDYPVSYTYNAYGERISMTTTRASASDTTQWQREDATGLVTAKVDAANQSISYGYDAAGRLSQRTWARGIQTTYAYRGDGALTSVLYSDSTPDVRYTLNRQGQPARIVDGSGSRSLAYSSQGQLQSEEYDLGVLRGFGWNHGFDAFGRVQNKQLKQGSVIVSAFSYAYDGQGQLGTVALEASGNSQTQISASYGYDALGRQISQETTVNSATPITQANNFNPAGQLTSRQLNGSPTHTYQYDAHGRRNVVTHADQSSWEFGYNSRSEVTSAQRGSSSTAHTPSSSFTYQYDDIGNRVTATEGGSSNAVTYTTQPGNHYSQVTGPDRHTLFARAPQAATLTLSVNGGAGQPSQRAAADPTLAYASWEPANQNGPSVTDLLLTNTTEAQEYQAQLRHRPRSATLTHDVDGNLLSDGLWTYEWDAENRLAAIQSAAAVPVQWRIRKTYSYDDQSRRIQQQEHRLNASSNGYQLQSELKWIYDGWNPAAEVRGNRIVAQQLWGNDLSGSLHGAGGVGGLIARVNQSATTGTTPETWIYHADGNGNIAQVLNGQTSQPIAQYEYTPFGDVFWSEGPAKEKNPWRFSTKSQETETRLLYYGYRYYDPRDGRWINRDPINEAGSMLVGATAEEDLWEEGNLYRFVGNGVAEFWDANGSNRSSQWGDWGQQHRNNIGRGNFLEGTGSFFLAVGCGCRAALASFGDASDIADEQLEDLAAVGVEGDVVGTMGKTVVFAVDVATSPFQVTNAFLELSSNPITVLDIPRNAVEGACEEAEEFAGNPSVTEFHDFMTYVTALIGGRQVVLSLRKASLNEVRGAAKGPRAGGQPNSRYYQVHPTMQDRVIQTTIYNKDGDSVGQVDWKWQHGNPPGHGHRFPPARPDLGHGKGPVIPPDEVPRDWSKLPDDLYPIQR